MNEVTPTLKISLTQKRTSSHAYVDIANSLTNVGVFAGAFTFELFLPSQLLLKISLTSASFFRLRLYCLQQVYSLQSGYGLFYAESLQASHPPFGRQRLSLPTSPL